MSYILNALRKSDRERQATQPVTSKILEQEPERRQNMSRWVSFIVIVNFIVIACLFWYVGKKDEATPVAQAPKRPPVANVAESQFAAPSPIEEPQPEKTVMRATNAIAELPNVNVAPKLQSTETVKTENKSNDASRAVRPVQEQKPISSPGTPVARAPVPAPIETPNPDKIMPPELKPERTDGIPWLRDMPFEFRQAVPKMNINVFVYANEPAERFVLIDMVKYRTGQSTKDGVDIVEIKPDGLVVRYDGRVFKVERP